jgi:hypothetical protein
MFCNNILACICGTTGLRARSTAIPNNISPITLWLGKAAGTQKFSATSNATKVGTNWFVIHSAMDAAKSIPSPIRCLASLSHARGLVP